MTSTSTSHSGLASALTTNPVRNPTAPRTVDELVAQGLACMEAGASIVHMHLPDISGLDVVRMLSEEIANRQLRVTILTGDRLSMDIIKAMSLGAFDYLVKPVSPDALEAGVRRGLAGRPRAEAPRGA